MDFLRGDGVNNFICGAFIESVDRLPFKTNARNDFIAIGDVI